MSVDLSGAGAGPGPTPMHPMAASAAPAGGSVLSDMAASTARTGAGGMVESAVGTAKTVLDRGIVEVRNFVEQNPSQVRATVFLMALASAVYCGLGIFNIFALSFTPVEYMVNVYLMLFAIVTLMMEGKPEWPGVSKVQEKIFFQAHFLSTVGGRAGFYIFQGTFGMARYDSDLLQFLFGVGFFAIGVLVLLQQWRTGGLSSFGRENLLREYHAGEANPAPQTGV